jgi:hypothetical protein
VKIPGNLNNTANNDNHDRPILSAWRQSCRQAFAKKPAITPPSALTIKLGHGILYKDKGILSLIAAWSEYLLTIICRREAAGD